MGSDISKFLEHPLVCALNQAYMIEALLIYHCILRHQSSAIEPQCKRDQISTQVN